MDFKRLTKGEFPNSIGNVTIDYELTDGKPKVIFLRGPGENNIIRIALESFNDLNIYRPRTKTGYSLVAVIKDGDNVLNLSEVSEEKEELEKKVDQLHEQYGSVDYKIHESFIPDWKD